MHKSCAIQQHDMAEQAKHSNEEMDHKKVQISAQVPDIMMGMMPSRNVRQC